MLADDVQYVYAHICMYVQVCTINYAQAEECNGLTDDWVSSHVLADDTIMIVASLLKQTGRSETSRLACPWQVAFPTYTFFLSLTLVYLQIHTNTYKYIQIHANTCIPTWQSAPKSAVRPYMFKFGLATAGKSKPVSQSRASGRATGPWGDEHPMQSVPG